MTNSRLKLLCFDGASICTFWRQRHILSARFVLFHARKNHLLSVYVSTAGELKTYGPYSFCSLKPLDGYGVQHCFIKSSNPVQ
jgi:hypothetical protein